MNLYTDSPRSAEEFFPAASGWKAGALDEIPPDVRAAALRLLPKAPVSAASVDLPPPWRCAVVVEHAVRSQFDVLVGALREGLEIPGGLICIAGSGDGFHGQRGRPWAAVRGNLHVSVCLSPECQLNDIATGLSVFPAVSLVRTLDSLAGLADRAGIRWINDVVINEAKLAGYLVHSQSSGGRVTGAIIGIGLNVESVPKVAPTVFVPSVTALREHASDAEACTRPDILRRLLDFLALDYERLVAGGVGDLLEFYRARSVVVGQRVEVYSDQDSGAPGQSAAGTVAAIGDRLELILAGRHRPVSSGRIVIQMKASSHL